MIRRGLALGLMVSPAPLLADPVPAPGGVTAAGAGGVTVTIDIAALRSMRGMIRACLTAKGASFPNCDRDAAAQVQSVPARNGPVLVFRHVAPGNYAVSLFHDENGNGRFDKMLGIPTEGYGFSRDAAVNMAPPRFDAARFAVGGMDVTQKITVRYLL